MHIDVPLVMSVADFVVGNKLFVVVSSLKMSSTSTAEI